MPRVPSNRRARRRQAIAATFLVVGLVAGVICAWQFGDQLAGALDPSPARVVATVPQSAGPAQPAAARKAQPWPAARPVYPFSIISGGVQSADELRIAMRFDPVVAAHFADFDLSRTHVERVAVDRAVYVSYRAGNRVGWTSRRLTLKAGETILTDGQNQARTRCGNRISELMDPETYVDEPSVEVLDTPVPPTTVPMQPETGYEVLAELGQMPAEIAPLNPDAITSVPLPILTPFVGPPDIPVLPTIPIGFPVGDNPPDNPPGPEPVPEPGTLLLVSPALGLYALLRRARRARKTDDRQN